MTPTWTQFPPIVLASPVLAVLAGPDGVWAGGFGGVAWRSPGESWTPLVTGLPLATVSTLAYGDGRLLAGGAGGITQSPDHGRTWWRCQVLKTSAVVSAIAVSRRFGEDGVALAGTLEDGILRSTDAGRSWQPSSFGLPPGDVLDLAWGPAETVIAATSRGLVRSGNGGRSWKPVAETVGVTFVALAPLPDGPMLAAPEDGRLWRAAGDLTVWEPAAGVEVGGTSALAVLADASTQVRGTDQGILRSTDDGGTWIAVSTATALSIAATDRTVYAGTGTGVEASDDGGLTWATLPPPPLHDLRRLLIVNGAVVVSGTNSPPVRYDPDGGWTPLPHAPRPLSALGVAPDGALIGASPHGLFRSDDEGAHWQPVIAGGAGAVTQLTLLPNGAGWAGVTEDAALLRTGDGGRTWDRLPSPFGVRPLVALQAIPAAGGSGALLAATYDDQRRLVTTWRSDDGGERWRRGGDTTTPWPVVATTGRPPVLTIGNVLSVQRPDGEWRQTAVGGEGLRRVVAAGAGLVALAVDGLWWSEDTGATWRRDDVGLPVEQVMDIAINDGTLVVLLTGGRVWSRPL